MTFKTGPATVSVHFRLDSRTGLCTLGGNFITFPLYSGHASFVSMEADSLLAGHVLASFVTCNAIPCRDRDNQGSEGDKRYDWCSDVPFDRTLGCYFDAHTTGRPSDLKSCHWGHAHTLI